MIFILMFCVVTLHRSCFPLFSNSGFWRGTPVFMWTFLLLGEATESRLSLASNDLNTEELSYSVISNTVF